MSNRLFSLWKKNIEPVKFIRPVITNTEFECGGCNNETEAKLNRRHKKAVENYNAVSFDNEVEKQIAMQELLKVRTEISEYVRRVYGTI